MKYLILGSAGQIGTGLCRFLKLQNHEIFTYDIADNIQEDLRIGLNDSKLNEYFKQCDFVFFLAFDVGGSRYLKKYQHTYEFINNNIKLIEQTFALLKKYNKPFIFCSSQMSNMVYSSYGVLKSIGEFYTKILNGIIVKFWNVYGVETNLEKSHVITDFILSAKNNNEIKMLTNGKEERQFLYEKDCCKCLKILADNYNIIDRNMPLHITSFNWTNILNIARIICNELGTDIKILPSINVDEIQLDKRNEPNPAILDLWKPEYTLETGIREVIQEII